MRDSEHFHVPHVLNNLVTDEKLLLLGPELLHAMRKTRICPDLKQRVQVHHITLNNHSIGVRLPITHEHVLPLIEVMS